MHALAKKLSCIPYVKVAGKLLSLCFYPLCPSSHEFVSCSSHHHSFLAKLDGPGKNSHTPQLMALHVFVPWCVSFLTKSLIVICWLVT